MYKTILVPLDGSRRAEAILPHVESLAHGSQTRVIFLQVIDRGPLLTGMGGSYPDVDAQALDRQVRDAKTYLAARCGQFRQRGIEADAQIALGPVVENIVSTAAQEKVDLIAMASHGRGGFARAFYGSVAAGVLQRVDRPLLLVRSVGRRRLVR